MTRKEKIFYLVIYVTIAIIILSVVILWIGSRSAQTQEPAPAALSLPDKPDEHIIQVESSGITAEVSVFDVSIIEDGLNDMSILITDEYFFTEVASFSSVKQLLGINIGFTESAYMMSYDGTVEAGIDFSDIHLSANEEDHILTVTLPDAEILSVVIDPDSFTLHSEKQGLGNPISVEDFNGSLVELKHNAEEKAIAKGILERANENAETLITGFIQSLPGTADYTICFEHP